MFPAPVPAVASKAVKASPRWRDRNIAWCPHILSLILHRGYLKDHLFSCRLASIQFTIHFSNSWFPIKKFSIPITSENNHKAIRFLQFPVYILAVKILEATVSALPGQRQSTGLVKRGFSYKTETWNWYTFKMYIGLQPRSYLQVYQSFPDICEGGYYQMTSLPALASAPEILENIFQYLTKSDVWGLVLICKALLPASLCSIWKTLEVSQESPFRRLGCTFGKGLRDVVKTY